MKNKHSRNIDQYTKNNIFIQTWSSATEAYKVVGKNYSQKRGNCIHRAAKGFRPSAYGYIWKYPFVEMLPSEEWLYSTLIKQKCSNYGRILLDNGAITFGHQALSLYSYHRGKSVHKIIASLFDPIGEQLAWQRLLPGEKEPQVDHIIGIRKNFPFPNAIFNLQWLTPSEHGRKTKLD